MAIIEEEGYQNRGAGGRPVIGGESNGAVIDTENPGAGADPFFQPPTGPAPVAPRLAGMSGMDEGGVDISDADLMTQEESIAEMAGLLGMDGSELGLEAPPHDENIAEHLDEAWLDRTGQAILEAIDADLQSREPWVKRFKRGLELVGLTDFVWDEGLAPFEGASTAVHPMLAEAIVQAQARLVEEVWPAQGPAKTEVMGEENEEKRAAADRVQNHMNFQLTVEDPTYVMESEKLAFYLPIFGTAYRKGYHDYVTDQNVLRYIKGEDLIIPYSARDVASSKRKTHRYDVEHNEFLVGVRAGAYRDVELQDPGEQQPNEEQQVIDKVDGKVQTEADEDITYKFYETDLYLDIPGYEDLDPITNMPTGVAMPYTVTLEKESGKILAIRRCWDEQDPLRLMENRYAEYWYLPGLGAYGFGLIHMIGGLSEAGTDALRGLLDSATWANLQGGFKAKDSNVKAGEMHMRPGVWADVDMTSEELASAFHTPPFHEPSEALFKLLDFLTKQAQRFASTTDMMVGDSEAKGAPVGTTVALIEQGSKVYSGVHKRAHFACGVELRMLFRLNSRFIPPEGYPYLVPGEDRAVYQQDYDTSVVSVVPVSDPNIYSQTQRIALAQSEYQLAQDNPAYFKRKAILERMLKAFKDPNPDEILIDPDNVPLMDPISENIAMVTGRPVKAKDGENHDLHLVMHMSFAQHPQFGGSPEAQKMFGPAMMAHIAEHVALKYADTMRALGAPVPQINLSAQAGTSIAGDESPEQATAIALAGAQMVQAFMQSPGMPGAGAPEEGAEKPGGDKTEQQLADEHEEAQANVWSKLGAGLASFAKAGTTLAGGMAAEDAVMSGKPPKEDTGGGAFEGAAKPTPAKPKVKPKAKAGALAA